MLFDVAPKVFMLWRILWIFHCVKCTSITITLFEANLTQLSKSEMLGSFIHFLLQDWNESSQTTFTLISLSKIPERMLSKPLASSTYCCFVVTASHQCREWFCLVFHRAAVKPWPGCSKIFCSWQLDCKNCLAQFAGNVFKNSTVSSFTVTFLLVSTPHLREQLPLNCNMWMMLTESIYK